ncbi:hypothetical protein D3C75_1384140 [compost metagenome]
MLGNQRPQRFFFKHRIQGNQRSVRVNARQRITRGVNLWLAESGIVVQRLSLQIGE